jgi:type I thyroxine 5'-deiodinase
VAFLVVYILEAHPTDVWQMRSNLKDNVLFASPKSEEERALVAGACVRKLGIRFPAVLDEFGNSTERAYTGWPDRLYLIDSKGQVAYKSKPGPFGFKPDELATALQQVVGRQSQAMSQRKTLAAHGARAAVGEQGNAEGTVTWVSFLGPGDSATPSAIR